MARRLVRFFGALLIWVPLVAVVPVVLESSPAGAVVSTFYAYPTGTDLNQSNTDSCAVSSVSSTQCTVHSAGCYQRGSEPPQQCRLGPSSVGRRNVQRSR